MCLMKRYQMMQACCAANNFFVVWPYTLKKIVCWSVHWQQATKAVFIAIFGL